MCLAEVVVCTVFEMSGSVVWLYLSSLSAYAPLIVLTAKPQIAPSILGLVWLGSFVLSTLVLWLWVRSIDDGDTGVDRLQNVFTSMTVFILLAMVMLITAPIWSTIVIHQRGFGWLVSMLLGVVATFVLNVSWYTSLLIAGKIAQ